MIEFLDFYVAQKVPTIPPTVRLVAPAIWAVDHRGPRADHPARPLRPVDGLRRRARRSSRPTRRCASTGRSATPPGVVARRAGARAPRPATPAWPIPDVKATSWYFQPGGGLGRQARVGPRRPPARPLPQRPRRPGRAPASPAAAGIWAANPTYDWKPVVDGKSLAYISSPLPEHASRWPAPAASTSGSRRTARDADLQVTLSEVRPDGTERYVQNGWLRLSHRKLDHERSTELAPFHTDLEEDARPMPRHRFVRGPGADLPVRVLVPGREPDPAHDPGARRRPAASGRSTRPTGGPGRDGEDRPRPAAPVPRRAPGPARRTLTLPDAAGAVPVAAGRAVPHLRRARRCHRPLTGS